MILHEGYHPCFDFYCLDTHKKSLSSQLFTQHIYCKINIFFRIENMRREPDAIEPLLMRGTDTELVFIQQHFYK